MPANARVRAGREADADEWRGRLEVHGLDLRDLRGVETFCAFIAERHEALDILVNNACQTVRRFSCGVLVSRGHRSCGALQCFRCGGVGCHPYAIAATSPPRP